MENVRGIDTNLASGRFIAYGRHLLARGLNSVQYRPISIGAS